MSTALQRIERILIMKWSALGDVAIASAIMEDVHRAFPRAAIHLNTLPSAARFFAADPRFAELVVIDVREKGRRWRRNLEWLRRVRAGRYDLIIDLQRTDHTRLLLAALRVSVRRIGAQIGTRGGFPYSYKPHIRTRQTHTYFQMRSALHAAGIPTTHSGPVLYLPEHERLAARQAMAEAGLRAGEFLLLLPGSQAGGWLKRWGVERYAALSALLLERGAVQQIAVLGGPEEVRDCLEIVARIHAQYPNAAVHLDRIPLLQIPVIAAAACYVVGNDTGTAHIAAAGGRPMLVICGPTDPQRVKPLGPQVRAVQADFPCLNCYGKTCRLAAQPACLVALSPATVATTLLQEDATGMGLRLFDDASLHGAAEFVQAD